MKTVGNVPVETVRCLILNGCHELTIIREDPTTHICTNCVVTIYTIYIYIMKVLFRMNRSVSSGVLSYLTPRFAWRFCCLDLLQAADVSNPTRPIRTARAWNSYVYEDNLFPSKKCLIERCGQRTERRQGWSVALYRIIPMFFPGKSQTICTKDSLLIFEGFPLSRTVFSLDICTFTQLDKIDPIKVNYSWIGEYTMVPYGSVIG